MAQRDTGKRKMDYEDEQSYKKGKSESTERYRAILHMLKEQMKTKEIRHEAMIDVAKAEAKEELLSEIMETENFDFVKAVRAVEEERNRAEDAVKKINVPTIDWDKMGEPAMNK